MKWWLWPLSTLPVGGWWGGLSLRLVWQSEQDIASTNSLFRISYHLSIEDHGSILQSRMSSMLAEQFVFPTLTWLSDSGHWLSHDLRSDTQTSWPAKIHIQKVVCIFHSPFKGSSLGMLTFAVASILDHEVVAMTSLHIASGWVVRGSVTEVGMAKRAGYCVYQFPFQNFLSPIDRGSWKYLAIPNVIYACWAIRISNFDMTLW